MKKQFKADWKQRYETIETDGLTENEIKVMIAGRINEYDDAIDGCTWSFTVADYAGLSMKEYRGVVASLIKKGLCWVEGKRNDECFGYTPAGKARFEVVESYQI